MTPISAAHVKELHTEVIERTGGSDGVRDENLLESALASAFQAFGDMEFYPTPTSKIARIAYGIIRNHPFVDGNKRTGTYVMLVLLGLNGIDTDFTDDDIVKIGLELANGTMDDKALDDIISKHTKQSG